MMLEMLSLCCGTVVFLFTLLRSPDRDEDGYITGHAITRSFLLTAGAMLAVFAIGILGSLR